MFFFMFSPCRRRTAGQPPFTAKIRMVCPLKALHCTSVSPPCRNILPNRVLCRWKRLVFVEGIKKERPASFLLAERSWNCAGDCRPVGYSFFRRHIYRHRTLSLTFQFSISLRDCFLRKREMFTSSIYSHRVFWKRAVTVFRSLPAYHNAISGLSMLFSDPFLFSLVCNTQHGQNTTAGKQQSDPQEHIAVIAGLRAFCPIAGICRNDSILTQRHFYFSSCLQCWV